MEQVLCHLKDPYILGTSRRAVLCFNKQLQNTVVNGSSHVNSLLNYSAHYSERDAGKKHNAYVTQNIHTILGFPRVFFIS